MAGEKTRTDALINECIAQLAHPGKAEIEAVRMVTLSTGART